MDHNRKSTIAGRHLLVDGKSFFIRGAEIQYFRLPRKSWSRHLRAAKDSGINTITACMSWHLHEPEEGRFEFTGERKPARDLAGFIQLVAEHGLKLIAHPGPFMNCEFRTGGIPEWLFRKYPETMSHRADGQIGTGRPLPAEGEPLYREYVKKWYTAVIPLFAQHQADRGGPIILFQPDNELSAAWSYGLLNSLYDATVIQQRWPDWLREKFKTIDTFNRLADGRCESFNTVAPPVSFPRTVPEKFICYEWLEFKRWFFSDWGAWLAKLAGELGLNVPVIFNEPVAGFYGHGDHAGFGNVLKCRGIEGTTVSHAYADRIFDLDGVVSNLIGVEQVKSSPWGGPPIAVEVNCNWFIPRCSPSAINWSPLLRGNLTHGLRGYSVFTYSQALTDLDDSINGPEYFEKTCLDFDGRPVYSNSHIVQFNRLLDTWQDSLDELESVPDVTLAYAPAMRILDFLGAPACLASGEIVAGPGGESFAAEPGLDREAKSAGHDWLDGYENVSKQTVAAEAGQWLKVKEAFALLSRLNMQFDMLDLANPRKQPGKGCLVVPCTGTLEEPCIDHLLEHIAKGGQCLFFPTIPMRTVTGKEDRRIGDKLGVRLVKQIRPAGGEVLEYGAKVIRLGADKVVTETGWIFVHDYPAGSESLGTYRDTPVIAKTGRVIVAGIDARFTTTGGLEFWRTALTEKLGVMPALQSCGNYYYASLLGTAEKGLLTVMNITGDTTAGELSLLESDTTMTLELGPTEARCLPINLELDGTKLCYSTSEILRSADGKCYELHGCPGTGGALAFSVPMTVYIDGKRCRTEQSGKVFIVNYIHQITPLRVSLLEELAGNA